MLGLRDNVEPLGCVVDGSGVSGEPSPKRKDLVRYSDRTGVDCDCMCTVGILFMIRVSGRFVSSKVGMGAGLRSASVDVDGF
jgi:hypothetical protein